MDSVINNINVIKWENTNIMHYADDAISVAASEDNEQRLLYIATKLGQKAIFAILEERI